MASSRIDNAFVRIDNTVLTEALEIGRNFDVPNKWFQGERGTRAIACKVTKLNNQHKFDAAKKHGEPTLGVGIGFIVVGDSGKQTALGHSNVLYI